MSGDTWKKVAATLHVGGRGTGPRRRAGSSGGDPEGDRNDALLLALFPPRRCPRFPPHISLPTAPMFLPDPNRSIHLPFSPREAKFFPPVYARLRNLRLWGRRESRTLGPVLPRNGGSTMRRRTRTRTWTRNVRPGKGGGVERVQSIRRYGRAGRGWSTVSRGAHMSGVDQ